MKKNITLLLLLFIAIVTNAQKTFTLVGEFQGEMKNNEVAVIVDGSPQMIKVDEQTGKFSGEVEMSNDQFVVLDFFGTGGGERLFVTDKEKINVTFKPETLKDYEFTADNRCKEITQFYNDLLHALKESGIEVGQHKWIESLAKKESKVKAVVDQYRKLLAERKKTLARESKSGLEQLNITLNYIEKIAALKSLTLTTIEPGLEALKNIELKSEYANLGYIQVYAERICFLKGTLLLQHIGAEYDWLENSIMYKTLYVDNVVKYVENGNLKNYLLSQVLSLELNVNGIKNEKLIQQVIANLPKDKFSDLKAKYEAEKKKVQTSQKEEKVKGFDFTFHDAAGKEYKLADFKGKLLYIDCWASWCTPCRGQIPYLKSLEKEYEGQDITFISVSLDQSKKAWEKAVQKEELHGYVLHAEGDFKNPFAEHYNIKAIPRFLLFDRDGMLISDEMPRPVEADETKSIIDNHLNRGEIDRVLGKVLANLNCEALDQGKVLKIKEDSKVGMFGVDKEILFKDRVFVQKTIWQENEMMKMVMGKDYRKPMVTKYNEKDGEEKEDWYLNASGYEIYYLKKMGCSFKIITDYSVNQDKYIVLEATSGKQVSTFYVNKSTYLVDMIKGKKEIDPYEGGGYFNFTKKLNDYQKEGNYWRPANVENVGMGTSKIVSVSFQDELK